MSKTFASNINRSPAAQARSRRKTEARREARRFVLARKHAVLNALSKRDMERGPSRFATFEA